MNFVTLIVDAYMIFEVMTSCELLNPKNNSEKEPCLLRTLQPEYARDLVEIYSTLPTEEARTRFHVSKLGHHTTMHLTVATSINNINVFAAATFELGA